MPVRKFFSGAFLNIHLLISLVNYVVFKVGALYSLNGVDHLTNIKGTLWCTFKVNNWFDVHKMLIECRLHLFIQMLNYVLYFMVISHMNFRVCFSLMLHILGCEIESVTLVFLLENFAITSCSLTLPYTVVVCLKKGHCTVWHISVTAGYEHYPLNAED